MGPRWGDGWMIAHNLNNDTLEVSGVWEKGSG